MSDIWKSNEQDGLQILLGSEPGQCEPGKESLQADHLGAAAAFRLTGSAVILL